MQSIHVDTFDDWRDAARRLLASGVSPTDVQWIGGAERSLFASDAPTVSPDASTAATVPNVPKAFLELARYVASHRESGRWSLLYRTLWRLTHGERHLLQVTTDDDVHQLTLMRKGVSRDIHKMKAFVRFRKLETGGAEEQFIAWHRPDHRIVRLAAPFFARRFSGMHWSILTPDESVTWDQTSLHYGHGVPVSEAPDEDALEDLWKAYYASIFNPARVKVAAMKREMPVRHWPTLPEATLIDDLLRQAPARADAMIQTNEGFAETAAHFMPERGDLVSLRLAAANCRACPLHQCATQTVFGKGSPSARIVLVGEQPGDREDIQGHPFVGPAGKLLDEALEHAGIERREVYITNVVKHFKFKETETPRGKRRLHQKPDSREIYACRPWLEAELAAIGPQVIVCLGATAAQALFGRDFGITKDRGKVMRTDWCDITIATWHPAAILRMQDAVRQSQMRMQLVDDLASVK